MSRPNADSSTADTGMDTAPAIADTAITADEAIAMNFFLSFPFDILIKSPLMIKKYYFYYIIFFLKIVNKLCTDLNLCIFSAYCKKITVHIVHFNDTFFYFKFACKNDSDVI